MSFVDEALERVAKWDAGDSVWSIEMGGLGPGYEQAIQMLAIEIIRDEAHNPLPVDKFGAWGDATVSRIDVKDPMTGRYACGGFSGAQVGAAKQVAYKVLAVGEKEFKASIPEDRQIQVSSFWPRAPKPPNVERSQADDSTPQKEAKT